MIRIILISLCLAVAGCGSEKKNETSDKPINSSIVDNPVTASEEQSSKNNIPVLKFDSDSHDFGTIEEGEKVSFAFKFQNVGNGDLIIRAAQGSCGCTVPEFPKDPVKPGAGGIINVTFNSEGKEGQQHKTVTVISNTMPNTYTLNVLGNVIKKSGE